MEGVREAIAALQDHGVKVKRELIRYSFGDREHCRKIFEAAFLECDKTVKEFKYLPEYENILQWMIDTKGTGLCFMGDCGRGKSTILTSVIPMLFMMKFRKVFRPLQAFDISPKKIEEIKRYWSVMIDDLGKEPMINDFGGKFEGFNSIVDNAESEMKPLFISTNLTREELELRYGLTAIDRINRLCRIVKFKGESLR